MNYSKSDFSSALKNSYESVPIYPQRRRRRRRYYIISSYDIEYMRENRNTFFLTYCITIMYSAGRPGVMGFRRFIGWSARRAV